MIPSSANVPRCRWAGNPLNIPYHDEEWGVPVHDERKWLEFLILEGAQAGLSWDTVLRKRQRYREVFDHFDPEKVARYDAKKVRALLADPGIIRNRLPRANQRVRRPQQGPGATRLPLRRFHHLLRPDAGHRHGQRSCRELLPLPATRGQAAVAVHLFPADSVLRP